MKLNTHTTDRIYRKSLVDLPTFQFDVTKSDTIFPFEVKTGFVNATEAGIIYDSAVRDYTRFERIFTGFEAISAIWMNSTSLSVDATKLDEEKAKKTYIVGNSLQAQFDKETMVDDYSALTEDTSFTKERVITTVDYYFQNRITADMLLNLYVIPSRYGKTLFFIDRVDEFNDPSDNTFKYAKATMHSLDDKLANTGIAIDQYVQFAAPGEGYAYPTIVDRYRYDEAEQLVAAGRSFDSTSVIPSGLLVTGEQFLIKEFIDFVGTNQGSCIVTYDGGNIPFSISSSANGYIVDDSLLKNRPVTRVQLELHSPALLSSVYAKGRPIKDGSSQNENLTYPRTLLPYNINIPDLSQRDITKPLAQNTSWYYVPRSRMEIESFYTDWTKKIEGNWNPAIVKKWLGYLRVESGDVEASTPWWAYIISPVGATIWHFTHDNPEHKTKENSYWQIPNVQSMPSMLAANYFIYKSTPRLPIDYKESIPWTLKNIPLIGGMAEKLTVGLPIGWKSQKDTGGKNFNIAGIMSQSLLDFYKNTFIGEKESAGKKYTGIPFDAFSDASQPSAISPGDFATIMNFDLTDQYSTSSTTANDGTTQDSSVINKTVPAGSTQNTVDLQFTNETYNEESLPVAPASTTLGFALDSFGFHALGQGDYKVTFFDAQGGVVYTGTYKTLSKLTGSIRDWNNNIKLSHWTANDRIDSRIPLQQNNPTLPLTSNKGINGIPNGVLIPEYAKYTKDDVQAPHAIGDIKVDSVTGEPIRVFNADGTQKYSLSPVTLPAYSTSTLPRDMNYPTDQHGKEFLQYYSNVERPEYYNPSDHTRQLLKFNIYDWIPQQKMADLIADGWNEATVNFKIFGNGALLTDHTGTEISYLGGLSYDYSFDVALSTDSAGLIRMTKAGSQTIASRDSVSGDAAGVSVNWESRFAEFKGTNVYDANIEVGAQVIQNSRGIPVEPLSWPSIGGIYLAVTSLDLRR